MKLLKILMLSSIFILSGCNPTEKIENTNEDQKYSIVTSSFYEYDIVREIVGDSNDNIKVSLLTDTGVDLHSYVPSSKDIVFINQSDLFIYNGGHSHYWVKDAIVEPVNPNFQSINIIESLGDSVKQEQNVEGMQEHNHHECNHEDHDHKDHDHEEHEHDHEEHDHEEHVHEDHEEHDHDHENCDHESHDHEKHDHEEHVHEEHDHNHENCDHESHDHEKHDHVHEDEHVWLSIDNAIFITETIAEKIKTIDKENAKLYEENAKQFVKELDKLDAEYEDVVNNSNKDTLIFTDRFPFLYLMDEYDIKYYAAFQGCSSETEATFETISFLAKKVDELGTSSLIVLEKGLVDLATTVNDSTKEKNSKILSLNSMQAVSQDDIDNGASYLDYMRENLKVIEQALK